MPGQVKLSGFNFLTISSSEPGHTGVVKMPWQTAPGQPVGTIDIAALSYRALYCSRVSLCKMLDGSFAYVDPSYFADVMGIH